ncbi:hypothetical protein R1sor_000736 [Riccia sorocarpa]|uniref:Uncharacterized protein n=1 Tax=Riccia sorocarpa TaxID=122646 RepID=A0ABD3GZZ0_9MARC
MPGGLMVKAESKTLDILRSGRKWQRMEFLESLEERLTTKTCDFVMSSKTGQRARLYPPPHRVAGDQFKKWTQLQNGVKCSDWTGLWNYPSSQFWIFSSRVPRHETNNHNRSLATVGLDVPRGKVHMRMLCDLNTALCICLRPWDGIFLEHFARGLLVLPWAMEILRVLVSRQFVSVWRTGLIPMEVLESSDSYKVEGDYHALKWAWSLSKVWKCDDASHSRSTADSDVESDHECQPTPRLPRDLALWRLTQRCLRRAMESSATSKTCDSGQDKIALLRDELAQQINCATGSLSGCEARIEDVGKSIDIENSLRAAHEHVREGRRFVAKAIEIANEALLLGRAVYDDDWVKEMEELLERLRKNNCD